MRNNKRKEEAFLRDLIISIILFSLLIALIIGNAIYINNEIKILRSQVNDIPSISSISCRDRVNRLRERWVAFKKIARISLSYADLSKMDCFIEELDCHLTTRNSNDFEHVKVMILNLLREMERLEKITADGIF